MRFRLSRHLAAAAVLAALAVPSAARAQTVWNLGALAGVGGSLGSTFTFTNGLLGSVTGFVTNSADRLYSKDFGSPLTDSEHGIGLCLAPATGGPGCAASGNGDFEIGDFGSNGAVFGFNLTAGNVVSGFRLSSVQAGEGWKVFYATTGTCNTGTSFSTFYSGTGPTSGDFLDQSTSANCFKFVPNGGIGGMDYLLETFTTEPGGGTLETVTPEPATLTLLATGLVGMVGIRRRRKRA